ncbi:PcaR/PcaU/PobR family beta-ketoadipate pathway transcriptional regulator [Afipia broomeae ATCC 49717]|uniref:PcaR/PcaU/PobR family beta-ketoadipate pathway transcriptional regulator n=1 Tax=Afipia broomeae ATCC 49717 TaxID=883078 RepID=K8PKT3_9BRAD|nr:PcaR/PcaU/PobR family beta-ketoadipate pathway transcriptional regulator [Afipia broomeae ATCC 49717]
MPVKRAVKRAKPESSRRPAEGMGGLAKGLAIIEALSSRGVQSAADAARAAQSTRAAARRCLLTLVALGYVERVGREFRPLPRLRNLGQPGGLRDRLIETSAEILAYGRDKLNESLSLAVLEGENVLFIARAEAEHIVSTGVRIGARLPAYCSATGRVLLGSLDDDDIHEIIDDKALVQRTPKTIVKPALILREIGGSRTTGFAISDEELELGMRSLAVPVHDADGKIVAALSVSAYSARVNRKVFSTQFLEVIRDCAAQLEERCFGKRTSPAVAKK